jgi:hypothetical protein
LNNKAVSVDDYIGDYTPAQIEKVKQAIVAGWSNGQTTREISQSITGTRQVKGIMQASQQSAYRMSKDITSHISSQTKERLAKDNQDIIVGEKVIVTLDSRTSPICQGYGSQDGGGKEFYYADDGYNFPRPPFHHNCILGGTEVTTCSDVLNVFKRAYKGLIVDITTKSGRKLSVTPNHPILTSAGWKPAKLINASDQLGTIPDDIVIGDYYKNSVVSEISDLFGAADVSRDSRFATNRPTTAKDFHGDSSDGEVNIVDVNGLVWGRVKSIISKKLKDGGLSPRSRVKPALFGLGALKLCFYRVFTTSKRSVGVTGVGASFAKGHFGHSGALLLRFISKLTDLIFNKPSDGSFRAIKAEELGDTSNTNPSFVSFDDVALVSFREVDCGWHVYNLENKDNWYLSNGIITHNCRSTMQPIMADEFRELDEGATRPAVVNGKAIQVPAETNWMDLAKQYPTLAEQSLGKTKAAMLDNMSAKEFTNTAYNRLGQPMTIEQMASSNAKAAEVLSNG